MDIMDIKAQVMAIEAIVIALARANPNKDEAFNAFANIFPNMVRAMNKSDADHPGLGKKLTAELERLSSCLR